MRTFKFCLILFISNFAFAQPSLYQNLLASFEVGALPNLDIHTSDAGKVSVGRCVRSTRPNSVFPGYFVGQVILDDPFIKYFGHIDYEINAELDYYDNQTGIGNKISKERSPLIQQDDGKSFLMEPLSRDWIFVRTDKNVLLAKIEIFEQDVEVVCYFSDRNL